MRTWRTERWIIAGSVCLGALFWVLNAFHDWLLNLEGTFWQLLITDVPSNELFSRISVFGLFLLFGTIVATIVSKRKQDELALRRSERHFRSLIENASDAICILNSDGTVRYESPSVERISGYQPGEMIGRDALDYLHPDDIPRVSEAFAATIEGGGQPTALEVRILRKDGSWRTVEGTARNLLDDETVNGIVVNYRDTTERKEAEKALRENQEKLKRAMETAQLGSYEWDIQTGEVTWSEDMYSMYGVGPAQLGGDLTFETSIELIHPDDLPRVIETIERILGGDGPLPLEHRVLRPDGTERLLFGNGATVCDEMGKPLKLIGTVQDITKRKQAEEALRKSEDRLKRYLESSPDIICVVDLQGIILYVNKATEELTGYKRAELVGKSFTALSLLTPESQSKPKEWTYRGGAEKPTRSHEVEIVKKDGSVVVLDIATYPMGQGLNAEIIAIGRDITEHRRMQEDKERMEQQLLLSGRLAAVGELAAGVAHELNNPLAAVQGYAQFLTSRNDLDESMREDVETIYKEAQRASRITANLLQFSRKHEPEKKLISINEVIEDSIELNAYRLKVNNIAVSTDLDTDLPKTLADFFQLQQVFVNLMTNAEQAMTTAHGQGTLTIKSGLAEGAIRVTFTDDGPGIPKENQEKIFDPFFTTKEVGEGTGLGLSICFGIVEQHGGTIEVKSTVGKGTVFTVELPAVAGDEKTEQNVANRAERPHEDGKQVGAS